MENQRNEKHERTATSTVVAQSTFLLQSSFPGRDEQGTTAELNDYSVFPSLQEGKPGFQMNSTSETLQHQEADSRNRPLSV